MLPLFAPQPRTPATGVSQTIIKQDHEKCETREVRTGNAPPRTMASLRNPAIGIRRHHAWTNIAKASRHNARDAYRPLTVLGINTP
jgi:hypothetical protein